MAEQEALTAEQFETWLTPMEALEVLRPHFPDYAAHTVISNRLRADIIKAAASHLYVASNPSPSHIPIIPQIVWEELGENVIGDPFWSDGDLSVAIPGILGMEHVVWHYLGVRFEPSAIRALIPKAVRKTSDLFRPHRQPQPLSGEEIARLESAAAPLKPETSEAPAKKKPRVEYSDLVTWHEAYKKIYGGKPIDTIRHARESANGMFPDRFVPKDWVEELCKGRTRGPKRNPSSEN
jgi:hypothetical protein